MTEATVTTRPSSPLPRAGGTPAAGSAPPGFTRLGDTFPGDRPVPCGPAARVTRRPDTFDPPVSLPAARGPVSAALIEALSSDPTASDPTTSDPTASDPTTSIDRAALRWAGAVSDATTDDDLQLALWLSYEQHYRGLAEVHDDWEWHPELVRARQSWEEAFRAGLTCEVAAAADPGAAGRVDGRETVVRALNELVAHDRGPSLSKFLMRNATSSQFAEFLVHRSLYHLKEADPHTWGIPRLSGSVKAAMVTIQADEYGGGSTPAMHAQLFRRLLQDWDLHDRYGHYLDHVPGVTLMASNLISMFGLNRRWRGALVGHLAMFEMTSSIPNGRYARGHRRLGGGDEAALFFDEHVVADSVHDQIALHDLAGGLAEVEPHLVDDIVFGARCAAYTDRAFAEHVIHRWGVGASSLRRALGSDPV